MSEECEWVQLITEIEVRDVEELRSGVVLCALIERLQPGSVPGSVIRHASQKPQLPPFTQRENIAMFLSAAAKYGVPDHELFETEDLYDARDLLVVTRALRSLSRLAHKKNPEIPPIGPRLAEKHVPPNFSSERYAGWSEQQYGPMKSMIDGAQKLRESIKERESKEAPVGRPKVPPKPANLKSSRIN